MAVTMSWKGDVFAHKPYLSLGQKILETLMWKSRGHNAEFLATLAQSRALDESADKVQPGPAGDVVPPKVVLGE